MSKPKRGTADSWRWMEARLGAYLDGGGAATRDAFVASERGNGGDFVTAKDLRYYPGQWRSLLATVVAWGPLPVDVSALDFDDDSTDKIPMAPVPVGHHVKGISTFVDADGGIRGQWIKTRTVDEDPEQLLERLLRDLPPHITVRDESIPPPMLPGDGDLLAVYPMGDPHIGLLTWAPETGEDFDLAMAERLWCTAFDSLATKGQRAAHALLGNLGDFLHADTGTSTTTKGTYVDTSSRRTDIARTGVRILVHTIDRLLTAHEHVTVWNSIGNHDGDSALILSVALDAYYRNEPRVTINVDPSGFHYMEFGKCLLGATHGDMAKAHQLGPIMAVDQAEAWGRTKHRYFYHGHIHHKTQQEFPGVIVESFRTLAPSDAWHTRKGYRSGRDMTRILLHREWGDVGRTTVSADYLKSLYGAAVAA